MPVLAAILGPRRLIAVGNAACVPADITVGIAGIDKAMTALLIPSMAGGTRIIVRITVVGPIFCICMPIGRDRLLLHQNLVANTAMASLGQAGLCTFRRDRRIGDSVVPQGWECLPVITVTAAAHIFGVAFFIAGGYVHLLFVAVNMRLRRQAQADTGQIIIALCNLGENIIGLQAALSRQDALFSPSCDGRCIIDCAVAIEDPPIGCAHRRHSISEGLPAVLFCKEQRAADRTGRLFNDKVKCTLCLSKMILQIRANFQQHLISTRSSG